ncbi:zinc ribbon domain-containing protein [Dictyobacter formicarum]|uniref:Zinc-ribbon domain-containing protein n=1 Tax=Dictyobacter formicarum TaxID=2778368 RepID=A0ABQ3VHR7_9CHLR|nr:zinc ribbon domain-containing protein [Dictyobacter formicarum]GHO85447.1 hypothetical protein KSZ_34530 [Dictyobacter formicarum]
MLCPGCQAPIESDAVFCGHCGSPLPPVHLCRSEVEESVQSQSAEQWSDDGASVAEEQEHQSFVVPEYPLTPLPASKVSGSTPSPAPLPFTGGPSLHRPAQKAGAPSTGRNLVFIAVILAILGVGIAAGIFALWQNKHIPSHQPFTTATSMPLPRISGVATFHDTSNARSGINSVSLSVHGLQPLANGSHYEAWLVNEHELHIQPLGTLAKAGDTYAVNFSQPDGNILALGNTLQVTVETTQATLPSGRVLLSAHFPPMAGMHINHLLVSYPETPDKIALLPGLLAQTRQLYDQSQQLRTTNDKTAIQCLAQNMLVLLDGQSPAKPTVKSHTCSSAHVPQLSINYGLLGQNNNGYVSTVGAHASLAATQTDSTDNIRKYAQQVIFSSENLSNWFSTLHQDAQDLLAHPNDHNKAVEIMSLADHALSGVDSNDNGSVEPIHGEAGAMQAYLSGQSMATLNLTSNK